MSKVRPIVDYSVLTKEGMKSLVSDRIRDLERNHYVETINLKIAEAKLDKGLSNAEAEVVDVTTRLEIIEISLTALKRGKQ